MSKCNQTLYTRSLDQCTFIKTELVIPLSSTISIMVSTSLKIKHPLFFFFKLAITEIVPIMITGKHDKLS